MTNLTNPIVPWIKPEDVAPLLEALSGEVGASRIADIYDDEDGVVSSALNQYIIGFEYPDFSHYTVDELRKKICPPQPSQRPKNRP